MDTRPILLAGPTASGKSALALSLARACGGMVVNADSQQVYGGWRVLTARPDAAEEAEAPHRLYGHVALDEPYSVGRWLAEVGPALRAAAEAGTVAILVGGTGLYFRALTAGLAQIPPIAAVTRAAAEAELERLGLGAFAAAFAARDPETAGRIDLANPARVLRAWEVLEETGRPLARWQDESAPPLLPLDCARPLVLAPPRATLYARCDARLDAMLAAGVLDEVRAVMAMDLPGSAPGLKAVGAPDLMAHLRGDLSLGAALAAAKTSTRRYAKRQLTWIRGQMADWPAIDAPDPDAARAILGL